MGRLAGPLGPKWEQWCNEERARMEEHRERLKALEPLTHPPTRRRQLALLSWIAESELGRGVGYKDAPPLTPDMRNLIDKGWARIERQRPQPFWGDETMRNHRVNRIIATPAGQRAVREAKVSDEDKNYVLRALVTAVLR